jgi:hypothetical protein
MIYKTKYVWNDNGLCDITHMFKKRRICRWCGEKKRYLVNVGYKTYEHMWCSVLNSKGGMK